MNHMDQLTTISPIDGRYADKVGRLRPYFSEMALLRYRTMIEIEYFIALSEEKKIIELPFFNAALKNKLRKIYQNFTLTDARAIKKIEKETKHDVKAVEYFIKNKIKKLPCKKYEEFIHFALTSEDTNNLSYSLMWQKAVKHAYLPALENVYKTLKKFAKQNSHIPLLALTHGQSATPTTVGKEFAVFSTRLKRQIDQLKKHHLSGKFGGATGTWGAHVLSYPEVDWIKFSKKFITKFDLVPNLLTTQIENHDSLAESFHIVARGNTVLLDLVRDIWLYVMRGVLGQIKKNGEVGSSTMPHKINPINFENAEGNLGLANSYLYHLAEKLPVSRLQRDLSDSTVLRNQGVPLAHSLLACENILNGFARLTVNKEKIFGELDSHWEILAEAVQIILRKVGYDKPYEKLKELTRGEKIGPAEMRNFIESLKIPKKEKNKLLKLTPRNYLGLAEKIK